MPWKTVEPMNQRTEFVLRAMTTDNFRQLCREYGISAKTGYKWKERFLEQGLSAMAEVSRRHVIRSTADPVLADSYR